jgi:4-amino-4-deoxy-L-arabinose transferase
MPDEFRYAEIPREMLASGDYVVPHLNGVPYFEKPVLGYWLSATAMALFGENGFAIRFPSAMAVGIAALLLFVLLRKFADDYAAAPLAAAAFLTCPAVFGVGTFNVLDSLLSLFLTAAMVSFFFAYMAENTRDKTGLLALFGVCCGLAFLTKGFLAFAIPVVAITPFMIWEGQGKELFRVFWLPLGTAVLIALPWSLMIHLRDPRFWHYFFWVEHIKRFISDNPQHPKPFWYFIPIMAGGALPWTILLPATIPGLGRKWFKEPLVRFAICWLVFPFLFFSASRGKLGTYILPCFPPFVIVTTLGLQRYLGAGRKRTFTMSVSVLAIMVGTGAVALTLSQVTGFPLPRVFSPAESWKWVMVFAGLMAWFALALLAVLSSDPGRKLALYCAAPLLLLFSAYFVIPDEHKEGKMPGPFLVRHSERVGPDAILVADKYLALAACWVYKRNDVYLYGDGGELAWGLSYDGARHRLLTGDEFRKLATRVAGKNRLTFITSRKVYTRYRALLPRPAFVDTYGHFVFVVF